MDTRKLEDAMTKWADAYIDEFDFWVGSLFYRYFYQRLIVFAHRHGWHKMDEIHAGGNTLFHCRWCGLGVVTERRKHTTSNGENTPDDNRSARQRLLQMTEEVKRIGRV